MKNKLCRFTTWLVAPCIALFFIALPLDAIGERKPLIYGICQKPFPVLTGLDYPLCRAEAWLSALKTAVISLPPALDSRLRASGFDTELAKLALCALLCPLDVVTPEHANSEVIRVFLKWPENPLAKGLEILDASNLFQMEMAFIWEMGKAIDELRKSWPRSIARAGTKLSQLEDLAIFLDDIWRATLFMEKEMAGKNAPWATAFPSDTKSPALQLARASKALPGETTLLDQALAQFTKRESDRTPDFRLWNILASRTLLLRSKIHAKKDSIALAEADLKTAIARLENAKDSSSSKAWLELGSLYEKRREYKKMCSALEAACASGECQRLSHARRIGQCQPTLGQ